MKIKLTNKNNPLLSAEKRMKRYIYGQLDDEVFMSGLTLVMNNVLIRSGNFRNGSFNSGLNAIFDSEFPA